VDGIDFLGELWPAAAYEGRWGEFRIRQPGRVFSQRWERIPPSPLHLPTEGEDVYFGVVPREARSGTADAVARDIRVAWADVDAKNFEDPAVALVRLLSLPIQPNIVVDSGGGFHAYWTLREPIDHEASALLNRGIARRVGGDNVGDAARILRLPGTFNAKYDPPRRVRLLRLDYRRTPAKELQRFAAPKPAAYEAPTARDTWRPLGPRLEGLVAQAPPKGERSDVAFSVVRELVRAGLPDEQIEFIFASAPIGEKYREKGRRGPRWLGYVIRAAERSGVR
jgi:hypothetical protein